MNVTLQDFCPFNIWMPNGNILIDRETQRTYLNEPKSLVGFKCFLLTIGTIPVHLVAATKTNAEALWRIASFSHYRHAPEPGLGMRLAITMGIAAPSPGRWQWMIQKDLKDLGRIALSPITIIGLELSAIYGLISPWNGRKLYASFERLQYGDFVLAPCFQPDPVYHLFNITIGGWTF